MSMNKDMHTEYEQDQGRWNTIHEDGHEDGHAMIDMGMGMGMGNYYIF